MTDLTKLLDGNADEVTAGLAGLSRDDLTTLQTAERGGKNRKGVMAALESAIEVADDSGVNDTGGADAAGSGDEDNGVPPADTVEASGAPVQIVPDVDMSHPAIDSDPRANTTAEQNKIDFNIPGQPDDEAVAEQLEGRGYGRR